MLKSIRQSSIKKAYKPNKKTQRFLETVNRCVKCLDRLDEELRGIRYQLVTDQNEEDVPLIPKQEEIYRKLFVAVYYLVNTAYGIISEISPAMMSTLQKHHVYLLHINYQNIYIDNLVNFQPLDLSPFKTSYEWPQTLQIYLALLQAVLSSGLAITTHTSCPVSSSCIQLRT